MKTWIIVFALLLLGLSFVTTGIYVGHTDDSPGAGLLGIVLALTCVGFALRTKRPDSAIRAVMITHF